MALWRASAPPLVTAYAGRLLTSPSLAFTSANGVRAFMAAVPEGAPGLPELAAAAAAVCLLPLPL